MAKAEKYEIPKLKGFYCFACGMANPIGLNLHFYQSGDAVFSEITLKKVHEGWQNMAHGGIISTLLDEVMSWTVIYFKRIFFVTRRMDVRYIKPILIGTPLTVKGQLIDDSEPPKIEARAEIMDDQGHVMARGTGEFIVLSKDRFSSVPDELKEEMTAFFARLPEL
ncbi:MAG: PaaI family thioesterase [Pseudomonadota bacterium]